MGPTVMRLLAIAGLLLAGAVHAAAGPIDDAFAAYQRQDFAEAVRIVEPLAAEGDIEAQLILGALYYTGSGVTQDFARALEFYTRAAEQGDAAAMRNVGVMHEAGQGTPADDARAAEWYRKAADLNDADAQLSLGSLYLEGRGVGKDPAVAETWYRRAAEQGLAEAQNRLGEVLELFLNQPSEALLWYRRAADDGGLPIALFNLGRLYAGVEGVQMDLVESYVWLSIAQARGIADATGLLDLIATGMSPQQIDLARTRARVWTMANPVDGPTAQP